MQRVSLRSFPLVIDVEAVAIDLQMTIYEGETKQIKPGQHGTWVRFVRVVGHNIPPNTDPFHVSHYFGDHDDIEQTRAILHYSSRGTVKGLFARTVLTDSFCYGNIHHDLKAQVVTLPSVNFVFTTEESRHSFLTNAAVLFSQYLVRPPQLGDTDVERRDIE